MADTMEDGALLFAGRLLSVNSASDAPRLQIKKEAIAFLQRLAAPLAVVSVHGAQAADKAALLENLLGATTERESVLLRRDSDVSTVGSVLMYVKAVNDANVKYLVVLSRPDYGDNRHLEILLYSIMSALSSVVLHVVDGELTDEAVAQFSFLARDGPEDDVLPVMVFPQKPKLMWLLQNLSTSVIKERVEGKKMTAQDAEAAYLRNVLAALQSGDNPKNALVCEQLQSAFTDQVCYTLPEEGTDAFSKRMEKLVRTVLESDRNRYAKGAVLNGPFFESILVSMLAHRDNVFQAFRGRIWKDTIHNCCLNIVESGIKLYKLRMAERLGKIVDTSDLNGYKPIMTSPRTPLPLVELPCESDELERIHDCARREAKSVLRSMPVREGKLNSLLKKLFKDLIESLYIKIQDENHKVSSEACQQLLGTLHAAMKSKVEQQLQRTSKDDEDAYAVQSSAFKRFFHHYQMRLYELMSDYTVQAKGPAAKEELASFAQTVIRIELADWTEKLEKIRQHDLDGIQEKIEEREQEVENSNMLQRQYQKEAMSAQTEVNEQLVDVAKLQGMRKEALDSAILNLDRMHELAQKQKDLLEEEAFVSIQLPSEKVIEAAQETEPTELQGYLIKQGGGGNAFNPLGRKNWKQRYFILLGASLIYAKTKDEYERGKIIKELLITGCRIEPSRDAGEGFNIIPPASGKQAHVFELHQSLFDKNSKKRSSTADSGRTFKLRAQSIEERDIWIDKLRKAAGGYR